MKNHSLDAPSIKILAALQKNSRLSTAELAEEVGLSATPCWRRQKELEDNGYITRSAALVDRRKAALMVCRHSAGVVEAFGGAMQARAEVVECYETTGSSDYTIKVIVPDMEAYQNFLHEVMFKLQGVAQINTNVALREVKYQTALPL